MTQEGPTGFRSSGQVSSPGIGLGVEGGAGGLLPGWSGLLRDGFEGDGAVGVRLDQVTLALLFVVEELAPVAPGARQIPGLSAVALAEADCRRCPMKNGGLLRRS